MTSFYILRFISCRIRWEDKWIGEVLEGGDLASLKVLSEHSPGEAEENPEQTSVKVYAITTEIRADYVPKQI
jgi:hypothetical protein